MQNHITTKWKGGMLFETNSLTGTSFYINDGSKDKKHNPVTPKALLLSTLAGCSGLDIASLIDKMKLKVDDFRVETFADLTAEHPKTYSHVRVEYHFEGNELNEKKLQRCVDLSVEKYCGVMEMFRQFAQLKIETIFHQKTA